MEHSQPTIREWVSLFFPRLQQVSHDSVPGISTVLYGLISVIRCHTLSSVLRDCFSVFDLSIGLFKKSSHDCRLGQVPIRTWIDLRNSSRTLGHRRNIDSCHPKSWFLSSNVIFALLRVDCFFSYCRVALVQRRHRGQWLNRWSAGSSTVVWIFQSWSWSNRILFR